MVEKSDLLRVPAFAGLPDDQIEWFLSQSEEAHLKAGEAYFNQGDPADAMYVILEGQIHARGELGGETVNFEISAGQVTGRLPFSRMQQLPIGARAVTDSHVLRFPASKFQDLVQKMPELANRLVGIMSDRIRETTRREQQRDRLAALGKLSAGLAHELNNPASAAKRAASQLRSILIRIRNASHDLGRRELTPAQRAEIEKLEASITQHDEPPADPLTISSLEDELDSLLRSHGLDDLWQLAADLAPEGILVNAVAPGLIETAMTAERLHHDSYFQSAMLHPTPLRRAGRPEEVAAVIAFLASADASFVSGEVVAVDGGWLSGRHPPRGSAATQ